MRILIVAFYFPPDPGLGANRPARTAEFLASHGHDVRVLSAAKSTVERKSSDCLENRFVFRTGWFDILRLKFRGNRSSRHHTQVSDFAILPVSPRGSPVASRARRWLSETYNKVVVVPDHAVGWIPFAIAQGKRSSRSWQPDVILASGPPFSVLFVARSLGRFFQVPWVADYRDLWTRGPYYPFGEFRRAVDSLLEDSVCKTAARIVTVSEPHAEELGEQHGLAVDVARNGFDDFPLPELTARSTLSEARLNILYVGNNLYEGRHDPTPIFQAASDIGLSRSDIRFHFLGTDPNVILPLARAAGIESLIEMHPTVDRSESLIFQTRADCLMLLLWDDPSSVGVYSGKLFEYVGARRPILYLGYADGVAADLIRERDLGYVVTDRESAAGALRDLLATKPDPRLLPDLDARGTADLSRSAQSELIEASLESAIRDWKNSSPR